jgi:hypothetical protein
MPIHRDDEAVESSLKSCIRTAPYVHSVRMSTHLIRSAAAEWMEASQYKRLGRSVVGDGSEVIEVM